jgi:hypothetical protein
VTEGAAPVVAGVRPTPDDDEMAAIVAAIELAWPRTATSSPEMSRSRWRFSGRWWSRPVPTRRDRP